MCSHRPLAASFKNLCCYPACRSRTAASCYNRITGLLNTPFLSSFFCPEASMSSFIDPNLQQSTENVPISTTEPQTAAAAVPMPTQQQMPMTSHPNTHGSNTNAISLQSLMFLQQPPVQSFPFSGYAMFHHAAETMSAGLPSTTTASSIPMRSMVDQGQHREDPAMYNHGFSHSALGMYPSSMSVMAAAAKLPKKPKAAASKTDKPKPTKEKSRGDSSSRAQLVVGSGGHGGKSSSSSSSSSNGNNSWNLSPSSKKQAALESLRHQPHFRFVAPSMDGPSIKTTTSVNALTTMGLPMPSSAAAAGSGSMDGIFPIVKQPKIKVKKILPEGVFAPKRGRPPKVPAAAKVDSAIGGVILNTTKPAPKVDLIANKKPAFVARGIQGFDAQLVMQTLSSVIADNDDDFSTHGGVLESSEQPDGHGGKSSGGTTRAMMMHGHQHDEDDNATVSMGMEVDHADQERADVGVDRDGDETETEDEVEGTPVMATARTTARLEQKEAAKREREAKEKNREKSAILMNAI